MLVHTCTKCGCNFDSDLESPEGWCPRCVAGDRSVCNYCGEQRPTPAPTPAQKLKAALTPEVVGSAGARLLSALTDTAIAAGLAALALGPASPVEWWRIWAGLVALRFALARVRRG